MTHPSWGSAQATSYHVARVSHPPSRFHWRAAWQVVESWSEPIDAPQNMFIVSIPTVLDPSLAPEGKHLVHIYTAGNEPYALWEGMKRGSPEYEVREHLARTYSVIHTGKSLCHRHTVGRQEEDDGVVNATWACRVARVYLTS